MQRVERSIRVHAPVDRVYEMWHDFASFPEFMENVERVTVSGLDGRKSHWRVRGPLGKSVEYDAEMVEDDPNRSIGWRSTDGDIGTSGNVTFADMGEGDTLVHVVLQWFDPPAGAIGEAVSHVFQNPEGMLDEDLRRFKERIERGGATGAQTRVA